MSTSKYTRLSGGGSGSGAPTYNSIFTYTSGGRQSWTKKYGIEGGGFDGEEDNKWKNTDNFCDIAGTSQSTFAAKMQDSKHFELAPKCVLASLDEGVSDGQSDGRSICW